MPHRDRAHRASCFVISITPFAEDGRLDEDRFRAHMRRLAAGGFALVGRIEDLRSAGGFTAGDEHGAVVQHRGSVLHTC